MLVRVMTYNILDGGIGRESAIRSIVRENRPDILVFQEVIDGELPAAIANDNDLHLIQTDYDGRRRVCILTRYPVLNQRLVRLSRSWRQALRVDLNLGSRQLSVVGVHPIANPAWWFEFLRVREAEVYLRLARETSDDSLIVGDMNAVGPGDPVRLKSYPVWLQLMLFAQGYRVYTWAIEEYLRAGYVDVFRTCNPHDSGWTLPANKPNTRLDYIFASRSFSGQIRGCRVVDKPVVVRTASDHLPVMAVFEL